MYRYLSIIVLVSILAVAASAQYCTNVPTGFACSTPDEFISNVTVGSINNSSACGPGYEDFSAISTGFTASNSYTINVTVGQWFNATDQVTAYVDWNGDVDFDDAGESFVLVQVGIGTGGGTVGYIGTILSPGTIVTDPRLRVVLNWGVPVACPVTPQFYGNVEDYGGLVFTATWLPATPGSGTLGFSLTNGNPNGTYVHIVTLNAGAYPNGWFFGIDTSFSEIAAEVQAGFPFVGPLDASGNITVGPFGGLPPNIVVYSVAFSMVGGTGAVVSKVSNAATGSS